MFHIAEMTVQSCRVKLPSRRWVECVTFSIYQCRYLTVEVIKCHRTMGTIPKYKVAMADVDFELVCVQGRPGSGKGTVCKRIAEEFGYVHLSAGELLRKERAKVDSLYRELVDKHYSEDSLVSPDIMCILLETAVEKSKSNKFLFDSFPINKDNLET